MTRKWSLITTAARLEAGTIICHGGMSGMAETSTLIAWKAWFTALHIQEKSAEMGI